jgi:hypothetical protein
MTAPNAMVIERIKAGGLPGHQMLAACAHGLGRHASSLMTACWLTAHCASSWNSSARPLRRALSKWRYAYQMIFAGTFN